MMFTHFQSLALALLSFSAFTLAIPGGDHGHPTPTCGPSYFTSIYPVTSVYTTSVVATTTQVATIPHSCFTYVIPVPQSDNSFCGSWTSTCGPTPDCITLSTFTAPCKDPCCPTTATTTTLGGCRICQTGCGTSTTTVTSVCTPTYGW